MNSGPNIRVKRAPLTGTNALHTAAIHEELTGR